MAQKTDGLINFTDQLTEAFPGRVLPDGWIGDSAHRSRRSSHNPDDTKGSKPEWEDADSVPEVRAADVKVDFGCEVTGRQIVNHLANLPKLGTVIRYMIHDGQIWHVNNDFDPEEHDGDPHEEHIHVTFAFTEAADDNTTYDYRFGDIPVALTSADKSWITSEIRRNLSEMLVGPLGDVVTRRYPEGDPIGGDNPKMTVGSALEYGTHYADSARYQLDTEVVPALARIEQALKATPPAAQ